MVWSNAVSATRGSSQRLRRLEQILADVKTSRPLVGAGAEDAATLHLESVPLERIRQLSELLQAPDADDDVDRVTMRLLLNDYATAVAHLRAVSGDAAQRLDSATEPVNEVRRFLWREEKRKDILREAAEDAAGDE